MTNGSTACFTSKRPDWATPWNLFNRLNDEFHFTLDVCATPDNAKCKTYFTPEDDGLAQFWGDNTCWMNPPYGRGLERWIKKAYEAPLYGARVVGLIPARTDTRWFHDNILDKAEIRFLRGRIKFVGASSGAPFPSMIIIWKPKELLYA